MTLKTTKLRDAIAFALVMGATAAFGTGVAFAQTEDEADDAETLDTVVVTGTRIQSQTITASSPVTPPSTQSVAEIRTDIGRSLGHAARMARKTSSGKRRRFSSEPPNSSVRWLASGVMKLESR